MLNQNPNTVATEVKPSVSSFAYRGWNITIRQLENETDFPYEWHLEKNGVAHRDPTSHGSSSGAETHAMYAVDSIIQHEIDNGRCPQQTGAHAIQACELKAGMWMLGSNSRQDQRIVDTDVTRDGQVKVAVDYGNGGEPGTMFFEPNEHILVAK